ncbi:uncharacterized protein TrAFT101_002333 [Trichoderma asperellum]|uniref:Uncharacterized protein n=1 Tax=Trichoderma asperellum (strain ATCC 204424 / CBS 433.97 / NBRC 101777) TaxID=1042311 RepID=A0A2T3YRE0_TRIA4|nr:hypothetical protein M441DRAFT_84856 [Trichoderma asperellum CBS 433.97]PTB35135.1 hypothetical protein M441DRAFT_84856 [Trichoderma asperellum CBS 433.97]UKZ86507.1 hypothetical protein TrAFT101_002333 [Trichoderma asperellum]
MLVGQSSAIALTTTVTTPSPRNIVTMFRTVSASLVTVTVTTTPAPTFAIPSLGMSAVDTQAPKWNITKSSEASTTATVFAQRRTTTISGPSGVFIGIVGAVAGLSILGVIVIVILHRKRKEKEVQV